MFGVIVADDEKRVRSAIIKLGDWEGIGLQIIAEACDGDELCALVENRKPEIVLTDMRMPGINGAGLVQKLDEIAKTKIIIISGFDDFEYTRQAINSRVVDYILKPVDEDNLNQALRKAVSEIESEKSRMLERFLLKIRLNEALSSRTALENGNVAYLKQFIEELYHDLAESGFISADDVHQLNSDLLLLIEKLIENIDGRTEFSDSFSRLKKREREEQDIERIKIILLDFVESISAFITTKKRRMEKSTIYHIRDFIGENYQTRLSLGELAKKFFLSEEYISKTFKEEFGQNLFEYIMKLKIEKAGELILKGLKVREIAYLLGFSDESHFSRTFKKHTGKNPRMYRK